MIHTSTKRKGCNLYLFAKDQGGCAYISPGMKNKVKIAGKKSCTKSNTEERYIIQIILLNWIKYTKVSRTFSAVYIHGCIPKRKQPKAKVYLTLNCTCQTVFKHLQIHKGL